MSGNSDNPYAAPESVEETPVVKKSKPVRLFRFMHTALIVLAAPLFLYCATSPLLLEVREGWQHAWSFLFVIAYFGLFFRKVWAYGIVALLTETWAAQLAYWINNPVGTNKNMTHFAFNYGTQYLIYFALIAIVAAICALTSRRQLKQ